MNKHTESNVVQRTIGSQSTVLRRTLVTGVVTASALQLGLQIKMTLSVATPVMRRIHRRPHDVHTTLIDKVAPNNKSATVQSRRPHDVPVAGRLILVPGNVKMPKLMSSRPVLSQTHLKLFSPS